MSRTRTQKAVKPAVFKTAALPITLTWHNITQTKGFEPLKPFIRLAGLAIQCNQPYSATSAQQGSRDSNSALPCQGLRLIRPWLLPDELDPHIIFLKLMQQESNLYYRNFLVRRALRLTLYIKLPVSGFGKAKELQLIFLLRVD